MSDCICEWPSRCHNARVVYCEGCGGDQCYCVCGGESDCFGCQDCDEPPYEDGPDPDEGYDRWKADGDGPLASLMARLGWRR